MTIDEALAHEKIDSEPCSILCTHTTNRNDCIECRAYHKQLAEWLKELKAYREVGTVEECRNSVLDIPKAYNKAIDDFVKEICKMIVQSENNGNYRFYAVEIKQAIADLAEQLKAGGVNGKERS